MKIDHNNISPFMMNLRDFSNMLVLLNMYNNYLRSVDAAMNAHIYYKIYLNNLALLSNSFNAEYTPEYQEFITITAYIKNNITNNLNRIPVNFAQISSHCVNQLQSWCADCAVLDFQNNLIIINNL